MALKARSANRTSLKYIGRKKGRAIALIPGWASDFRIFDHLDIGYDYIVPAEFSPSDLADALAAFLKEEGIPKVSLFGWSLGGYVAQGFCGRYPELTDEVILVGMRKRYDPAVLKRIARHITRSKEGYLYSFYNQWFHGKDSLRNFKKGLLKSYIEKFDTGYLLKTLEYLGDSQIDLQLLRGMKKVTIVHGTQDRIAPFAEAIEIKDALPQARFIPVEGAGHAPFLEADLRGRLTRL